MSEIVHIQWLLSNSNTQNRLNQVIILRVCSGYAFLVEVVGLHCHDINLSQTKVPLEVSVRDRSCFSVERVVDHGLLFTFQNQLRDSLVWHRPHCNQFACSQSHFPTSKLRATSVESQAEFGNADLEMNLQADCEQAKSHVILSWYYHRLHRREKWQAKADCKVDKCTALSSPAASSRTGLLGNLNFLRWWLQIIKPTCYWVLAKPQLQRHQLQKLLQVKTTTPHITGSNFEFQTSSGTSSWEERPEANSGGTK